MATISVCITYYNRPETLAATLESLAVQTRLPDEVFLWDNCSPQCIDDLVEAYRRRFKHFRYHRNSQNLGMPGNLNAVIPQATGDYIANLHDADVYHPQLLEKWAAVLDESTDVGLAFSRDSRWRNKEFATKWTPEPRRTTAGAEFFESFFQGRVDSLVWGTVMARRTIYEKLLPFKPKFSLWADVDMWMRFCGEGSIGYEPEILIELDQNPTHSNKFSFARMALVNQMAVENIERLFSRDKQISCLELQANAWRRRWSRWMAGRLRRGDWNGLVEGWRFRKGEYPW